MIPYRLRLGDRYRLVLHDDLPAHYREALHELEQDAEAYGVLMPVSDTRLVIKAVDQETALLLKTVESPRVAPTYFEKKHGARAEETILRLVMDGVLDIEVEGRFISGSEAAASLQALPAVAAPPDSLGRLAIEAIRYAERLPIDSVTSLSARMYFYNRLPASQAWRRRFPSRRAVARWLGLESKSVAELLAQRWTRIPSSANDDGWHKWRLPGATLRGDATKYKLYISPQPDAMRGIMEVVVPVLTHAGMPLFKVGADLFGLLRPDKVIVYHDRLEPLLDVARELGDRLGGMAPHGVPFTCALRADGLVSWGVDPPKKEKSIGWLETESWRVWLTNRLAVRILQVRAEGAAGVDACAYAIHRLSMDGVDVERWSPSDPARWLSPSREGYHG